MRPSLTPSIVPPVRTCRRDHEPTGITRSPSSAPSRRGLALEKCGFGRASPLVLRRKARDLRSMIALRLCPPLLASLMLASLTPLAGCGFPKTVASPPAPLTDDEITLAQKQSPQSNGDTLNAGRTLYVAKCNGCHGYPDIATIADGEWPEIVKRMAKKSDISSEQEAQVLAFIRAAKDRK